MEETARGPRKPSADAPAEAPATAPFEVASGTQAGPAPRKVPEFESRHLEKMLTADEVKAALGTVPRLRDKVKDGEK